MVQDTSRIPSLWVFTQPRMIRFSLFGFPVEVHWPFWLTTVLLSGVAEMGSPEAMQMLVVWVGIVFVSILVHELGHALAMRYFGDNHADITLYSFGGFARGRAWRSRTEQIIISAAGPIFSALLGCLGMLVDAAFLFNHWLYNVGLQDWYWVNFGWTLLNILPILPLDGGRIMEAALGPNRSSTTLRVSMITAGIVALFAVERHSIFSALFFGMLAFSSWKQLNHERTADWMRP